MEKNSLPTPKNHFLMALLHKGEKVELVALGFLVVAFLFLQFIYPNRPGMERGEGVLHEQILSVDILRCIGDGSFWQMLIHGQAATSKDLYHGVLLAYLHVPFLALFGPNWMLIKFWPLFLAFLALLFAYGFVRDFYGRKAAVLAFFLLLIHPGYMTSLRIASTYMAPMHFFSMGSLYFLGRWWKSKNNLYFSFGLFLLGLGMFLPLWFYWFWIGLATCLVFFLGDVRNRFGLNTGRRLLGLVVPGLAGLLLGLAPIFYRDIFGGFGSVRRAFQIALSPDNPNGLQNYCASLPHAIRAFHSFLSGQSPFDYTFMFRWANGADGIVHFPANRLYPYVFWLALLFILILGYRKSSRHLFFLPLLFLGMMAVTPLGNGPYPQSTRFFFLYPLPAMLVAVATIEAFRRFYRNRGVYLFLCCALLTTVVWDIQALRVYFHQLRTTGGARTHSYAIVHAAEWLNDHLSSKSQTPVFFLGPEAETYFYHLYFMLSDRSWRWVFPEIPEEHPVLDPVENFKSGYLPLLKSSATRSTVDERPLSRFSSLPPFSLIWSSECKTKLLTWQGPFEKTDGTMLVIFGQEKADYSFSPIQQWLQDRNIPYRHLKQFQDEDGFKMMDIYGVGPGYETTESPLRAN